MPKQYELDQTYMGVALLHSKLSKAKRKQAGIYFKIKGDGYVYRFNWRKFW